MKKRLNLNTKQIIYLVILIVLLIYLAILLEIKKTKEIKEQEIKDLLQESQNQTQNNVLDETSKKEVREISNQICLESWFCTSWSDCRNNIQKRGCLDLNNCKTFLKKPPIEQPC